MADRASVVTPNRGSLILQSLKRLVAFREFALSVVLIVMGAAMAFASPVFLDVGNLQAILLALSVEATIAVGMMLLLDLGRTGPVRRFHSGIYRRRHRPVAAGGHSRRFPPS